MRLTIKEISEIKCRLPKEEKIISNQRIKLNNLLTELADNHTKLDKLAESLKKDEEVLYRNDAVAGKVRIPFYDKVIKDLNNIQKGISDFNKESQLFQKSLKKLDLQKVRNFKNLTPSQQKNILSEIKDLKKMFEPYRYSDENAYLWMKTLFNSGISLNVNSHHLGYREKEYKETWKPVHQNLLEYDSLISSMYSDIESLEKKLVEI